MGRQGIPIIHLLNIDQLLEKFGLPSNPVPLPDPGDGGIFIEKKYNLLVTAVSTAILVIVIVFIYLAERKRHRLGTDVVPTAQVYKDDESDGI
jgi:hypothetical protein